MVHCRDINGSQDFYLILDLRAARSDSPVIHAAEEVLKPVERKISAGQTNVAEELSGPAALESNIAAQGRVMLVN